MRICPLFLALSAAVMVGTSHAEDMASMFDDLDECCACDCCSCGGMHCLQGLGTRQRLFGNLLGAGSPLAQHGIIADLQLTQFYQGVASGGADEAERYGGKVDYMFTFLSEQMGLWKGGTLLMHAETRFGESIGGEAGAFAIPNTNMLYPLPGEDITSITGLLFLQALNERFSLVAGKVNSVDFWTMFYPNVGRGVDGFMNLNSLAAGMPWLRYVQLSENVAGLLAMKGQQPQGAVIVFDPQNSSTTSGVDNLFNQGAAVLGIWRFFTDWNGKPGSHLFAGGWSSRKYTAFDDVPWGFIPGQGLVAPKKSGAWTLGYYYDQVFWADPCNDKRKLQLFTGWSISDGNPSFSRWNGFVSVEGFGLIPCREQDRAGVAYFYNGLSDDFRRRVSDLNVAALESVQGVEFYYNAAITSWFQLTGDLQFVDNEDEADDTAVILGLRAKITL